MSNTDRVNFFVLDRESFYDTGNKNIKKVVSILNKDKLVIIKWLKNIWKINFIKEFISKTKLNNNYFYFNKSDDISNTVSVWYDLEYLLNEYTKLYKNPKIIILQDISKIEWVKDFISKIYKENYKTILIWNTIKIWWIKELEIHADIDLVSDNIKSSLKYGSLNEVKSLDSNDVKKKYLNLSVSDIFLNDIFKNYWVKSIELYIFTMKYLANNSIHYSLRELQKKLDYIQKISLKTTIDYIDFSLQEKIIKRSYLYDLKNNKAITTKAKYYFSDNGIRNSLADFNLSNDILVENLIFNILELHNYDIYSWTFWNFDFAFYWILRDNWYIDEHDKHSWAEKIYIHITNQNSKEEIKKEISKFQKIWDGFKKYILIKNIEDLWFKKTHYDDVEVVEIDEFLIRFEKK